MKSPEKQTAVYKLFHYKYQCNIPETEIYSDAMLETHGMFISGDEKRDMGIATSMSPAVRTIAEMATIFSKGLHVNVPNNDKLYQMYKIICEHLNDCIDFQRNGMFGRMPPHEDLVTLDKFAAHIFPMARWHFIGEEVEETSNLMRFINARNRKASKDKKAPDIHEAITPKLNTRILDGGRSWR